MVSPWKVGISHQSSSLDVSTGKEMALENLMCLSIWNLVASAHVLPLYFDVPWTPFRRSHIKCCSSSFRVSIFMVFCFSRMGSKLSLAGLDWESYGKQVENFTTTTRFVISYRRDSTGQELSLTLDACCCVPAVATFGNQIMPRIPNPIDSGVQPRK